MKNTKITDTMENLDYIGESWGKNYGQVIIWNGKFPVSIEYHIKSIKISSDEIDKIRTTYKTRKNAKIKKCKLALSYNNQANQQQNYMVNLECFKISDSEFILSYNNPLDQSDWNKLFMNNNNLELQKPSDFVSFTTNLSKILYDVLIKEQLSIEKQLEKSIKLATSTLEVNVEVHLEELDEEFEFQFEFVFDKRYGFSFDRVYISGDETKFPKLSNNYILKHLVGHKLANVKYNIEIEIKKFLSEFLNLSIKHYKLSNWKFGLVDVYTSLLSKLDTSSNSSIITHNDEFVIMGNYYGDIIPNLTLEGKNIDEILEKFRKQSAELVKLDIISNYKKLFKD